MVSTLQVKICYYRGEVLFVRQHNMLLPFFFGGDMSCYHVTPLPFYWSGYFIHTLSEWFMSVLDLGVLPILVKNAGLICAILYQHYILIISISVSSRIYSKHLWGHSRSCVYIHACYHFLQRGHIYHVIDALNPHVGLLVFCMPLMSAHVSSRFGSLPIYYLIICPTNEASTFALKI